MRTRQSICVRKVRYASVDDALGAARQAGLDLRPYRCDRCRRFHLTSRTKGKRVVRPADGCAGDTLCGARPAAVR